NGGLLIRMSLVQVQQEEPNRKARKQIAGFFTFGLSKIALKFTYLSTHLLIFLLIFLSYSLLIGMHVFAFH
ncbi:hypothetical protein, partial [Photobacterium leiognathi]|uniref:hypothetical protein n=1 Tax=Photobacterium leiognathi TaxID=553611 RepID=UPI0029816EF1